jgi:hypothetical protein
MISKALAFALAALSLFPSIARSEPRPAEAVASAAMESTRRGDWAGFAHSMHPEALTRAKELFRPVVAADESGRAGRLFFGVSTVKQYDAMSDSSAFRALMEHLVKNLPAFAEAMKTADFKILGKVDEGGNLVHVVYRADASAEDLTVTRTSVMSLRKYHGEWRLLLTGNIEGLAARLSQMSDSKGSH